MEMEQQFFDLIQNGNLQEIQEFYKNNSSINISADNEYAFSFACGLGLLQVAKWLLEIKPDINISINDEEAFRNACENGRLEVCQLLQSLKPYLYVIHYGEDGSYKDYYIRSKEEERWEKRKLLVWLASDSTPCKKNLLYRIPEDVSRYIIQMYL